MSHRHEVLRIYREIFRYGRLLPEPKRNEVFTEARTIFHKNMNEADPQQLATMIKAGTSRLNYLKMITPRQRGVGDKGKFVYENGKWMQKDLENPEPSSTVVQNPSTGDMLKRHNALISRQRRAGL